MNKKKRKNWDFYEMRVENKRSNFHQKLKRYLKKQLWTFLERNEYDNATHFVAVTLLV